MLLNSNIFLLRTHELIFFRINLDIVYLFCQFCLKCYFSVHCRLKATFKPWANSFIISTFMSIVEMLHIYRDVSGYMCIYMHLYVICLYDLLEKHQLNQVLTQSIMYIWTLSDTSNYFLVISPQLKFRVLSLSETKLYWVVYVYQTNVSPEFSQHWMPKILALWKYTIGI